MARASNAHAKLMRENKGSIQKDSIKMTSNNVVIYASTGEFAIIDK